MERSFARAAQCGRQAVELAERHGWTDEPAAGIAYNTLAAGGIWRRQLEEAADWVRRAERTLRAEADPMTAIVIRYIRALLELARGRYQEVLATFEAAERLSRLLDAPDWPLMRARALRLHALVRLGETGRLRATVGQARTDLDRCQDRAPTCCRCATFHRHRESSSLHTHRCRRLFCA